MNKKTQFFIIGVLIFSMALTSIFYLLSIPAELSKKSLESQTMDYNDFSSALASIDKLSGFMHDYWLKNYHEHAIFFSVKNAGINEALNQEIIIKLKINEQTVAESFYLSAKKENPKFSIIKSKDNHYLLNFNNDLAINEQKDYSLLFSTENDSKTYYFEDKKLSDYYEQGSSIFYESNNYAAIINKTTGEIYSLKLPGNDYQTISSLKAKVNSSAQNLCSSDYSFISYLNNVLMINFTCTLESVKLTQVYSFAPKFFSAWQNFEIIDEGNYNLSYLADSLLPSIATEKGVNESLIQPSLARFDSRYVSMFFQDKGILFINNDSIPYIASPNVYSEFRINQESFTEGNYSQEIIIMPYYNNYSYSLVTANNYFLNPSKQLQISKSDFLKRFKFSFSSILANNLNILDLGASSTIHENIIFSKAKESTHSFSDFSMKNSPMLNKTLLDESGEKISFSFSTKNYARNSTITTQFCNNESMGIEKTVFEFMKISGTKIMIQVNTSSEINALLYDHYDELLANETFSENTLISENAEFNGAYKLEILGQEPCFTVQVNAPLIHAKSPIIINSTGNNELFFSSKEQFTLEKTNIEGQANIILKNPSKTLINSSSDFSQIIGHEYYSPISYYLSFSQGMFYLSNGMNFGAKESYLSSDYEVTGFILKDFEGNKYYNFNDSLPNHYCAMNYSGNILNNTFYSIDFQNKEFNISGTNWASDAKIFSIDSSILNYSGIILDQCLVKSFQFDSANSSAILNAINNSKLFTINFENITNNFNFRINLRINGTSDNYYLLNSIQSYFAVSASTNSKSLINNYNFFGKNDSGTYFGIIFKADDLIQSSNALTAHNDYLEISLSKNAERIYICFADDYQELLRIIDGIKNKPSISNEMLAYNYSFVSQTFKSNGTIMR